MKSSLPEIDDRLLAMADGDWVSQRTASDVLASWFARPFAEADVTEIVSRLTGEGLLRCRGPLAAVDADAPPGQPRIRDLEFTATAAGSDYLRSTSG